uniref:Reverse transcriptase domain-containing protein n=1 Tax=Tanacetum cinerariifolium TaxID=118510 RepID=A0A6L2K089_TANCI|nr:hypothetical protein [Tanacetum cinerariifolium]
MPKKINDPILFTLPSRLGDSKPFDALSDLGSCVNLIPLYLFKMLNVGILEETKNVIGLADGTKSYLVGIERHRVQTPGSGISILLAVGTPSTGSGNLYCQWELSPGSGNALCILFPTRLSLVTFVNGYLTSYGSYALVPSPVEDYSDIGPPEVDRPPSPNYVPGPEEPKKAPLSPDYVPGLEEPEQAPPSPVYLPYVPEVVYLEYMPPEDDVFLTKEQPLRVAATPTTDSPGYIPDFDTKGDPEEKDEKDLEEDPADYPADSTVIALPAVDHVLSEERLCFASPTPSQEVRESSAVGAARQDEPAIARDDPYSLVREELYGFVDRETTIMYGIMEDAQDDRSQLRGRVNLLYRDRTVHRRLAVMIEREARMARGAWGLSMDASDNVRSDAMSLRTTLVAHHALILDLQAADHRRQDLIKELLVAEHKRQKMAPKRTTTSTPVITTLAPKTTTTTLVTNAQLQAMIDQGVTAALAARDTNRNGDYSHTSGMEEIDKVERYVSGLPNTIHGSMMPTKPKTMQDAIEFATKLMDKKINTWAERQADNKRKSDDITRNNQQQPNKRQNT